MIFIQNAHVIDARSHLDEVCSLLLKDGRIEAMGEALEPAQYDRTQLRLIDAHGRYVLPGLVDVHVHFRDPGFTYKEDIESGTRAAMRGGYTSVVMMANTKPAVDNLDTLRYVMNKGAAQPIRVRACATVTKELGGRELTDMEALQSAGAAGFTDDGIPILDAHILRAAMEEAARLGAVLSLHEEDPAYIENNGINAGGAAAAHYQIGGSDRRAEITMIERDVKLALETGAILNIQHISSKEGVEIVRRAKRRGDNIHAEATPHHFTLTEQAVIEHGTLAKMNPPLRLEEDRLAVIEGLRDGTIDLIATDHAPHSREEKERPITSAPSGIIGLETALPLAVTYLVREGHLTMEQLVERMSLAPARLYGINAGYLAPGGPGDLVIVDADRPHTVGDFASRSDNSPFAGQTLYGTVDYTIAGGRIVYQRQEV